MSVSPSPMLIWVLQWSQCFKIRVSQHWGKRGHVTVRAKVWEVNLKNCLENSREMVSVSTICDEYWSLLSTFITRGVFPDVLFQNVPRSSYAGQATNKHIMCFKSISKWVRRYLVTGGLVTPENSWWGCAARFSKSWPFFRPKKFHFPHPF